MGNDNIPDAQAKQTSSGPKYDSQEEIASPVSGESSADGGIVPAEVVEALQELPPEQRRMVSSMFVSMGRMSSSGSSALAKRVTPEHITQTLDNLEKDNEREFKKSQSSEITKRLGMGAILVLVLMVFGYAGIRDRLRNFMHCQGGNKCWEGQILAH